MPRQKKQGATSQATPVVGIDAKAAQIITNEYCLLNYGTSYVGGMPCRLSLPDGEFWIVPVVLTSPGYGMVGDVGMLAVRTATGEVVGATPRNEARAAGTELAREKSHDLDAAFRRARAT
jgi:hypothetical protein